MKTLNNIPILICVSSDNKTATYTFKKEVLQSEIIADKTGKRLFVHNLRAVYLPYEFQGMFLR